MQHKQVTTTIREDKLKELHKWCSAHQVKRAQLLRTLIDKILSGEIPESTVTTSLTRSATSISQDT